MIVITGADLGVVLSRSSGVARPLDFFISLVQQRCDIILLAMTRNNQPLSNVGKARTYVIVLARVKS